MKFSGPDFQSDGAERFYYYCVWGTFGRGPEGVAKARRPRTENIRARTPRPQEERGAAEAEGATDEARGRRTTKAEDGSHLGPSMKARLGALLDDNTTLFIPVLGSP